MPSLPASRMEIALSGDYRVTEDGKSFLAFDTEEESRIIGFATDDNLRLLCSSITVQCDGTFKTALKMFYQLYTLHVDTGLGNSSETVPILYALLPDKHKLTYLKLFKCISHKCKTIGLDFNPVEVMMDYEPAPINAVKQLYPDCSISGCNFHFNQCLWRKIQKIGLSSQYTEDSVLREHVRSVAALAHLPMKDVTEGWLELMEECPDKEYPQLEEFNDYFVETWLGEDATILLEMWNVSERKEKRTNNHVEGWNNKFFKVFGKHHPNIYEFVNAIKKEQSATDLKIAHQHVAMAPPKKKRKYRMLNERLQQHKEDYALRKKSVKEFLHAVGHLLKLN